MADKNHNQFIIERLNLVLKNASSLILIVLTGVFISACDQRLSEKEKEEIAANHAAVKETLAMLEESRKLSEEARRESEEIKKIVDDAHDKAQRGLEDSKTRKKISDVQHAVQTTVLALMAYNTEEVMNKPLSGDIFVVDDIEGMLFKYGWRRNPDLVYEIKFDRTDEYSPYFVVTVHHQDPNVPAFRYDSNSGRGVEQVE